MKIKLYFFLLSFLAIHLEASDQLNLSNELDTAQLICKESEKMDYKRLISVADRWPRLDLLGGYQDQTSAKLVEKQLNNLLNSFSTSIITSKFETDKNIKKENLENLIALHSLISTKSGYSNQVVISALETSIQVSIFSLLIQPDPDLVGARKALKRFSKDDKAFDFSSWLQKQEETDPWLANHRDYVDKLPRFASMGDIIFPLIKSGERIPNKYSSPELLEKVSLLQLGICKYESNFINQVVLPFWISYVDSLGMPKPSPSFWGQVLLHNIFSSSASTFRLLG